jgi:hypothetical protein
MQLRNILMYALNKSIIRDVVNSRRYCLGGLITTVYQHYFQSPVARAKSVPRRPAVCGRPHDDDDDGLGITIEN